MWRRGKGRPKKNIVDDSTTNLNVAGVKFGEGNCFDESQPAPEFFHIYFSAAFSHRLRIPPSFMKNFDGIIPAITLKTVPGSTSSWLVDPVKINHNWYFQNGWAEFVQDNSLTDGDFLTFRYDGISSFYVKVFTVNGCLKMSAEDAERLQGNTEQSKRKSSMKDAKRRITSSNKPCNSEFFKVLLPKRLASKRLVIPPDYIKHFGRTVQERIMLKDEVGKCWHVSVVERLGRFFIEGAGWQKFVDDKCLGVGDFLVFRYDRGYSFSVKTFGTDACKKGTLGAEKKDTIRVKIEKNEEAEPSLAFGKDECKRGFLDAEKNAIHSEVGKKDGIEVNAFKRARTVKQDDVSTRHTTRTELLTGANEIREEDVIMIDDEPDEPNQTASKVSRGTDELTEKNDRKDYVIDVPGITKRPCFVSPPYKVPGTGRVQIPNAIISSENIRLEPEMVLCDGKGNEWCVKVYRAGDGRWYIGTGYTKFRRENNLSANDLCKFTFHTFSNRIDVQILCS